MGCSPISAWTKDKFGPPPRPPPPPQKKKIPFSVHFPKEEGIYDSIGSVLFPPFPDRLDPMSTSTCHKTEKVKGGVGDSISHFWSLLLGKSQSWWTFRTFFIFLARGRGRWSPRRQGVIEHPRRGGVLRKKEGGGGREGVCSDFGRGGGANFFFSGPKCPPSLLMRSHKQKKLEMGKS